MTWPRCKYAVSGKRNSTTPLAGTYLDVDGHQKQLKWSDGFKENVEYFRLEFLDPDTVARGKAFNSILPILWMMGGCQGERDETKANSPWYLLKQSPFAVLLQEKQFHAFRTKLSDRGDITLIFLVTDSDESFSQMRRSLGARYECVQLYRSYLENFRINTVNTSA